MNDTPNTHLGKKILYGLVITLCCLTLILSVAGIIGAWIVQNTVGNAAVAALKVVETTTHTVRLSIGKVDNRLTNLYDRTNGIVEATQQLGQSASDKGLVMTLLPEEREQQLVETVSSLKETFADLRASLVNGLELYRRIERMPFVNLPGSFRIEGSKKIGGEIGSYLHRFGIDSKTDQGALSGEGFGFEGPPQKGHSRSKRVIVLGERIHPTGRESRSRSVGQRSDP